MKKVLIANTFGIGDAIFSMHVAESLRAQQPGAVIDFLGNERTEALLRLNATVRRVHVLNRDYLRSLWPARPAAFSKASGALLAAIRAERYDALFDFSLGREVSFFGMLMGIRRRFGLDYRRRGLWLTHKKAIQGYQKESVVRTQLGLLRLAGLQSIEPSGRLPLVISEAAQEAAQWRLDEFPGKGWVAVAPGGGRSWGANAAYKQWDPFSFAEIITRLSAAGIRPVLLGDQAERGLLEQTQRLSKVPALIAAGLPIGEVCALLGRCRALLANDGGLVHLAAALGIKTFGLYGPVDERVYGPFNPAPGSMSFTEPVACRPCYQRFHFPPCTHARACLSQLPVERVWKSLLEIT